jgi:hypothetical protein
MRSTPWIVPLALLFGTPGAGVPGAPQAAADATQVPRIDVAWFVYLTDISRTGRGSQAALYDQHHDRTITLSGTAEGRQFRVKDNDGETRLDGETVHVGARDVVFATGGKTYAIHLGQSLAHALDKPLDPEHVEALKKSSPPDGPADTFSIEMRNKPWRSVLEWLSDQTGIRYQANYLPPGSFTFIPQGKKSFTLSEVIDLLNDTLSAQGYLLVRRDQAFTVLYAGEPIDPAAVPRVSVEELSRRGNSELVSVTIPAGGQDAAGVATDVRRLLGPFGDLTVLSRLNQFVVQDTAGNVKRVVEALKGLQAKEPAKESGKSLTLEFHERAWPDVFAWLTEQTGMPVLGPGKPTGTLTFVGPDEKKFTIAEAIDVLNEALSAQNLLLIRREHSFAVVPTDEPIDPALVPHVKPAELASRGDTELVAVTLPLAGLAAEDAAQEAERLLSSFGRAVPLGKAQQLALQDTAGNIRRMIETIRTVEDRAATKKRPAAPAAPASP